MEVQPATIVELDEHTLTDAGKEEWGDILDAEVVKVYNGYYGLQMELGKEALPLEGILVHACRVLPGSGL